MKAVLLAAGKGERLRPLTDNKPKHLIPIGGRPLLEWTLRGLEAVGVKEVLVVTHYMEDQIKGRFGDGSALALEISYARQKNMLGTANAFGVAEEFVDDEAFIGLYGDLFLSSGVFENLIRSHRKGETSICIVPVENPSQFGVVELDGDRIIGIVEKPLPGEEPSNLGNTGIYYFSPQIFDEIRGTRASSRGEYEITDSIKSLISSGSTVRAVPIHDGEWLDIGLPWNILEANARALAELDPSIEGSVERGATLRGSVTVSKGARVRTGAHIEGPIYIGPGSDVGPNCYIRPSTSIGARVRVGNACEIKNSILMDGTHIAHLSYIGDSIIGAGCNLGAGTITANIRFDKQNVRVNIEDTRIDSGRRKFGSVIGDNAQTGINVSILPGIKIGSETWVSPGITVREDISSRMFLTHKGPRQRREI